MSDPEKPILDSLPGTHEMRRHGKNLNGYLGETIKIQLVLQECLEAGRANGWTVDEIPVRDQLSLAGLTRRGSGGSPGQTTLASGATRVYVSAGIHGDEPAGPMAIRQLLQENKWAPELDLWVCPCLNPVGFLLNQRENGEGIDLNRQYLETQAQETLAHIAWLQRQPSFDLCLCLHEDWESHGFYLYELNPDSRPSLAEAMVARVANVCPTEASETIEGRPAQNGIIRPSVDPHSRPQWPEAFFLLTHKTRLSYTLEAPSDFPLSVRVAALVTAVNTALDSNQSAGR